jgi:hypothetical protein
MFGQIIGIFSESMKRPLYSGIKPMQYIGIWAYRSQFCSSPFHQYTLIDVGDSTCEEVAEEQGEILKNRRRC